MVGNPISKFFKAGYHLKPKMSLKNVPVVYIINRKFRAGDRGRQTSSFTIIQPF